MATYTAAHLGLGTRYRRGGASSTPGHLAESELYGSPLLILGWLGYTSSRPTNPAARPASSQFIKSPHGLSARWERVHTYHALLSAETCLAQLRLRLRLCALIDSE